MEEDELSAAELEQLKLLEAKIQRLLQLFNRMMLLLSWTKAVGRLARLDAIQHQQIAKSQVARMRALLPIYRQRLSALVTSPEDFGECILCGELIPLKRC